MDEIARWYEMREEERRRIAHELVLAKKSGDQALVRKLQKKYDQACYLGD